MKLKNKKTGEILELCCHRSGDFREKYDSLAELNEEWEDMPEEPKEYYAIDLQGDIIRWARHSWDEKTTNKIKEIGNYFGTREEAEKAVKRLRAWKRLKDKGFRLSAVVDTFFCLDIFMKGEPYEAIKDDLKIVFGGEE